MGVDEGVLSIQPQIPEISVGNQMERTISVRSDQNIWDYLWRWSVYFERSGHFGWLDWNVPFHLTNCCPKYGSFVSCLQEQSQNARWLGSGPCDRNVPFHLARRISEVSNGNFCWMKSAQGEWQLIGLNEVEEGERRKIIKSRIKANQGVWRRTKVYIR